MAFLSFCSLINLSIKSCIFPVSAVVFEGFFSAVIGGVAWASVVVTAGSAGEGVSAAASFTAEVAVTCPAAAFVGEGLLNACACAVMLAFCGDCVLAWFSTISAFAQLQKKITT